MDGKVELTIDRYEELTALERNIKAKEKELDDLKKEAVDEKNVLVYQAGFWSFLGERKDGYSYEGKDKVLREMAEHLEEIKKARDRAQGDVEEYTSACFSDRLYYLFLGRLPGMK